MQLALQLDELVFIKTQLHHLVQRQVIVTFMCSGITVCAHTVLKIETDLYVLPCWRVDLLLGCQVKLKLDGIISDMQSFLDQLQTWSDQNNMQINSFKTKEMILGSASNQSINQSKYF